MRTYLSILIVLLLLGLVASAIAAFVEIESILVSGPACTLVAVLIAIPSYRRSLQLPFLFGLSVPTVSVLCFVMIFGCDWSPAEAHFPIGSAIVLCVHLAIPFGIVSLLKVRRADLSKRGTSLQYGIIELLGLMFFTAVVVAFLRSGYTPVMALAVLIAYVAVAGYVVHRFYARRRKIAGDAFEDQADPRFSQR
jgi:hypothetical protein